MTLIFALRNGDTEDHGEVVPALVLNIILACLNAITFVSSCSVAWVRRKKDSRSVTALYYGSMTSSAALSTILFAYRASHRVAALGGSAWIAAGEALTWILFQSICVQIYSWRMAKACSTKKDDISGELVGTLCACGVLQTVLVFTWFALLWKHPNPVYGSVLLVATVVFGAAKDLVIFSLLRTKLEAVAGKLIRRASATPFPVNISAKAKVIPADTVHPLSLPENSIATPPHGSLPKNRPPSVTAPKDGKSSGPAASVERGRGILSTEEAMNMLNDSLGQVRIVVLQKIVLSGVLVSVPALAHRPFILLAYMHVTRCGGTLGALMVLDGRNLRKARTNATQALSSIHRIYSSTQCKAQEGTLPCDVTTTGSYPTATR